MTNDDKGMTRAPIGRIYLFQFVAELAPITVLYIVILSGEGLSTFSVSVLIAAWSVASILFEVPSGAIADRYDRRFVLGAGQILTAIAFATWWVFPNVLGYFLGFVLWGAGNALRSGTFEALVYDELEVRGLAHRYVGVLGRAEGVYLMSMVVGALLASPLIAQGTEWILAVSIVTTLAGAALALSLPNVSIRKEVTEEQYLQTLMHGIKEAVATRLMVGAVAFVATFGVAIDMVSEYAPLFFGDAGFTPEKVALIVAVYVLAMAIGSALADRLKFLHGHVPWVLGAAGLALFGATLTSGLAALLLYGVASVLPQVGWVLAQAELQHAITGSRRATITSVGGFFNEVLNVALLVGFGTIAALSSREVAFQALGIFIAVSAIVLALVRPRQITPTVGG